MAELNDRGFTPAYGIGSVAEREYVKTLEYFKARKSVCCYYDLRDFPWFRLIDCDFVVFTKKKENGENYTIEDAEKIITGQYPCRFEDHTDFCKFVEVKGDTMCDKTGNAYIEWIAHNKPGCFGCSRADTWVYYSLDGVTEKPLKKWIINTKKLRDLYASGKMERDRHYWEFYCEKDYSKNYGHRIRLNYLVQMGVAEEQKA